MAQSYERDRDRRGFKELAKLAGSPSRPPSRPSAGSISGVRRAGEESDSGMIDLQALAKSDPGAVDRASVTPLASEPLFGDAEPNDDSVTEAFTSSPAARLSPPPARPSSVPPAVVTGAGPLVSPSVLRPIVSAQAAVAAPARRRSVLAPLASVVGLAALAAGAFFVVRTVRAHSVSASASAAIEAPRQGSSIEATRQGSSIEAPRQGSSISLPAVVAVAPPAADAPAQAGAPPVLAASDPGVDPLSLPKDTPVAPGHRATRAGHGAHGGQALAAKAEPEEAPAKAEAAPTPKEAAHPAPGTSNALLDSMKQSTVAAAPPPEAPEAVPVPAAAAAGPSSGVAPHPSQGQVTGALGAVISQARACLNEDDGVSRAHVVFGSDGAVQSVGLTGWAAGKPAEGCIKTALSKAHVPSFAEATYGATVTVRP